MPLSSLPPFVDPNRKKRQSTPHWRLVACGKQNRQPRESTPFYMHCICPHFIARFAPREWKDSQQIPRWLQYVDGDGLIYELTLRLPRGKAVEGGPPHQNKESDKQESRGQAQESDKQETYQRGFHHSNGIHLSFSL
jgi:hypothetical protein